MRASMATVPSPAPTGSAIPVRFIGMVFLVLLAGRLAHVGVLWVDEAYGAAAAQAMIDGRVLYRDLWFDKPPLYAWIYLLTGGAGGWPLRLLDAVFSLGCCMLAYGLARQLWSDAEARAAALLLAFFLLFGVPSATVSLAPDLLTVPFALGAAWLAAADRPAWAGFVAGAALLANAKALFLLPVLLYWCWPAPLPALFGFVGGLALTPLFLIEEGALRGYVQQVWVWGSAYSRDTPFAHPLAEGVTRTANWIGFHAALVLPACWYVLREPSAKARRLAVWFLLALVAVAGGWRFYPRYYFALLPVAVILAARGVWLMPVRCRVALLAITLAIPAIRFGKPQAQLALETLRGQAPTWSDLALYRDAQDAAARLRAEARPGDTLLVWGYRPEINMLAALPPGTRFLDSQPLTGVIADRHLVSTHVTFPELAAANRAALTWSQPTWILDGLGPLNPRLAITAYSDLGPWLKSYERVAETKATVLYRRRR
ncbi:MAG: glycosyltransferase family 39 protein [Bryobacterales bacterium]|nr:glycosyltransferase family 39 protein [Bryobacterales bacterium]